MNLTEGQRLAVLRSMGVLDTAPEEDFDELVRLAARIAGVPTALVSLVDADRQWFKARVGSDLCQTGRDIALCDHVVRDQAELEVRDARTDPRFADNPLVTGAGLVFYAGFPLTTRDGYTVGTLCLNDSEPRRLDDEQRRALRTLARQATAQLELRRLVLSQAEELERRRATQAALACSQREYRLLVEGSTDVISRHRRDGTIAYVSPSITTVLGFTPEQVVGGAGAGGVHPDDLAGLRAALAQLTVDESTTITVRCRHVDGSYRWMETTLAKLVADDEGTVEVYAAGRDVTERVRAEQERARGAEFVQAVLDSVSVGIVACDADGRLNVFNHAVRDLHGSDPDPDLPSDEWADCYGLFAPDGRTRLPAGEVPLRRALVEGAVEGQEMVIRIPGRAAVLVRCDGRAMRGTDGEVIGAVVAMSDITQARQAERSLQVAHDALSRSAQALLRSEEQFRSAFETGPMPMCRLDGHGVFVHANPAMRRLLGLGPDDPTRRTLTSFAAAADREQLEYALAVADGEGEAAYLEVRMRRDDGTTVWCEVAVTAGVDLDGAGYRLVQLADIEDRKRRELELEHRVARDDLTGLANRMELHRRLAELLTAQRGPVGVLFLDLDGFKSVNDTAGHAVGDEVLVDVARRLRSLVRDEDLVARLGGDEFVLVRQDRDGHGEARYPDLVDRVRTAFRTPFFTTGGEQRVGVSVGLVVAQHGELASAVLGRADEAMYADKRRADVPLQR